MDAQKMNITVTECDTEGVKAHSTPKMTKEEAQQKSDSELLQMIQQAQGHTGKDFSDYMNCDFSYTHLTNLLKDRGYENGWHKTSDGVTVAKPFVIQMKKASSETTRQAFIIEKAIADEWKEFNKNVPYKTVTLGYALRRFMEDYKNGKIKFEFEI